jgi:hypothetical protein
VIPSRRLAHSLLLAVLVGLAPGAPALRAAGAQEAGPELSAPDAIRLSLEQRTGQRVRLRLLSGQEIDGTVAKVGAAAVHVTQLTGMELFDAVVRLDQIAAVVFRRAAR